MKCYPAGKRNQFGLDTPTYIELRNNVECKSKPQEMHAMMPFMQYLKILANSTKDCLHTLTHTHTHTCM